MSADETLAAEEGYAVRRRGRFLIVELLQPHRVLCTSAAGGGGSLVRGRPGVEAPRLSGSESAWETPSLHASVQGSITSIPAPEKSRTFRVATAMARDRAIAAI